MTITSATRRAGPLAGNDSTIAFPFTFRVFADTDVRVVAMIDDAEGDLVLDTDYSIALNADQDATPGGTVSYPLSGDPLATGDSLVILGDLDYDQTFDIANGGNFAPAAFENALDRIVMQVQQLREILARSLQLGAMSDADPAIPTPEATSLIGWDSSAAALQNYPLSDIATSITYSSWVIDTFVGDGGDTTFTLSANASVISNLMVSIDGLVMVPSVDYTLSGQVVTFTTAPASGAEILIRFGEVVGTAASAAEMQFGASVPGDWDVEPSYVDEALNELADRTAAIESRAAAIILDVGDETTAITAGTAKKTFRCPYPLTLTGVRASLTTAQSGGAIFTVDVTVSGFSILSTKLTIDNGEKTSTAAVTPAVISDSTLTNDALIEIDVDQVGNGTAAGLKVVLLGYRS
jgi:hypothetical protein